MSTYDTVMTVFTGTFLSVISFVALPVGWRKREGLTSITTPPWWPGARVQFLKAMRGAPSAAAALWLTYGGFVLEALVGRQGAAAAATSALMVGGIGCGVLAVTTTLFGRPSHLVLPVLRDLERALRSD
jgi:hypothetical protein